MSILNRRQLILSLTCAVVAGPALAKGAGVSTGRGGVAIKGYDTRAYWSVGEPRVGAEEFVVE